MVVLVVVQKKGRKPWFGGRSASPTFNQNCPDPAEAAHVKLPVAIRRFRTFAIQKLMEKAAKIRSLRRRRVSQYEAWQKSIGNQILASVDRPAVFFLHVQTSMRLLCLSCCENAVEDGLLRWEHSPGFANYLL